MVCCHNAWQCVQTVSPIPRLLSRGIRHPVRTCLSALWRKTQQIILNYEYIMAFSISSPECLYFPLKRWLWCLKQEPSCVLLLLLHHMVSLNDGNCHLTMLVVKGFCAHDPLLYTFNIGVFNCHKSHTTAIKPVYNESMDFIESYAVDFDINGWWNLIETVQVIGMEGKM